MGTREVKMIQTRIFFYLFLIILGLEITISMGINDLDKTVLREEDNLLKNLIGKKGYAFLHLFFMIILIVMGARLVGFEIPYVANQSHIELSGRVVEYSLSKEEGMLLIKSWGVENYNVIIEEQDTGEKKSVEGVLAKELKKNAEVKIYQYHSIYLRNVLVSIDEKTTTFYKKQYGMQIIDKILLGVAMLASILLETRNLKCERREEKRKYMKKIKTIWKYGVVVYNLGILLCVLNLGTLLWQGSVIGGAFLIYNVCKSTYIIAGMRFKEDQEILENGSNIEVVIDDRICGEEENFSQMSQNVSAKYCDFKYKKRRNTYTKIMLLVEMIIAAGIMAVQCSNKSEIKIIIVLVLVAGMLFVLICWMDSVEQWKMRIKAASYNLCEYTFCVAKFNEKRIYRCVEGKRLTYSMDPTDNFETNEGEKVMLVYLPALKKIFVESMKVWDKVRKV